MTLAPDLADVWEMRPKLRQDVVFLDAPTGAYLRGADTAFLLKGRSAFKWLVTLGPYLTGEHSIGQLCASLDEGQQRTVATLIRALTSRGFAKDIAASTPAPEQVRRDFGRQIDFIDHFADDAVERFQRFRNATVFLGGAGETLLSTAAGLLRNGATDLVVHPDDDAQRYRDRLRTETERLGVDNATATISTGPLDPSGAAAVIYCAEDGQLTHMLELTRRCHTDGTLFVPVMWGHGRAILGPTTSGGESPCWLCGQMRLTANADPATAAQTWQLLAIGPVDGPAAQVDPVTAGMVGNAAAFEVFRALTGVLAPDAAASVIVLDTDTLESTRERVLRHPACQVCQHVPHAVVPTTVTPTDEELYRSGEILVSPNTGVFTRFTDDPLEQAPLKTARLKLPNPHGFREITAFDVHTVMGARLGAYRSAVQDYLGRLGRVDGAVITSAAELIAAGQAPVPWSELDTATNAVPYHPGRQLRWVPARVLGAGEEKVWVPAAVAFPFSAANRDGYAERTVAGSAVGASEDEVIANGLAGALAYRGLVATLRGSAGLIPVSEEELVADDDIALVVKAAQRFGCPPQLFSLVGAGPAHVVLAVAEMSSQARPVWAVGTGLSADSARLTALVDLVGVIQVQHFEGIDVDLGDALLRDFDPRTVLPVSTCSAAGEAHPGAANTANAPTFEVAAANILTSLAEQGHTALLVDHTTPDIRATQALRAGVVLLWRRATAA